MARQSRVKSISEAPQEVVTQRSDSTLPVKKLSGPRILAIDLGTKLGWCFGAAGEIVEIGTHNVKRKATEKITDPERRLRNYKFLTDRMDLYGITHIAVEQVNAMTMRGNRQREIHFGDRGCAELIAGLYGVPLIYVPVGTAKKVLTGHGNAKKPEMVAAAGRRTGLAIIDDNAADAVAVFLSANQNLEKMENEPDATLRAKPRRATKTKRARSEVRANEVR